MHYVSRHYLVNDYTSVHVRSLQILNYFDVAIVYNFLYYMRYKLSVLSSK